MTWTTRLRSKTGPLAYIQNGDGPPVLLIHGVGLRSEAWGAQIDALAQSHHVIAVDMPGHGDSDLHLTSPTLADFTDRIVTALDTPATVIGHSFGAMIALDMAVRYPDRVTGIVALNAIYRRSEDAKAAVLARAQSLDGIAVADPAQTLQRWFGDAPSPQHAACAQWLRAVDPAGYAH